MAWENLPRQPILNFLTNFLTNLTVDWFEVNPGWQCAQIVFLFFENSRTNIFDIIGSCSAASAEPLESNFFPFWNKIGDYLPENPFLYCDLYQVFLLAHLLFANPFAIKWFHIHFCCLIRIGFELIESVVTIPCENFARIRICDQC